MPTTGRTATMARARSGTQNLSAANQNKGVGSGHVLFEGQQIANRVKVQITGPYQLKLSYQPLGSGTWKDIDLDPIVQFAWFSHALQCGNVPQSILNQMDGGTTDGQLLTAGNQQAAGASIGKRVTTKRAT